MKATLICPSDRPSAAFFARHRPLALVPLLGRTALDHAMSDLALRGFKKVRLLAADQPGQIRAALREGRPWGLDADVLPVTAEPSPDGLTTDGPVFSLDHWPGKPHLLLWESPAGWFDSLTASMGEAGHKTLGMREALPGIWIGTKARVSSKARLVAPCWIGQNATIGPDTTIGPRSVIEEGACVDDAADVVESFVGPNTYVGRFTELHSSLAWGQGLLNWRTSSFTEVSDDFLLADLSRRTRTKHGSNLFGRLAAALALLAATPLIALAWLICLVRRQPLFTVRRGVRAPVRDDLAFAGALEWRALNGVPGMLRRVPELWNIMQGEFRWIGNRPLTHTEAARLTSEFERLWLTVPPGLLSLADAHGCGDDSTRDAARAHAAFYAARACMREDLSVLASWLRHVFRREPSDTSARSHPAINPDTTLAP